MPRFLYTTIWLAFGLSASAQEATETKAVEVSAPTAEQAIPVASSPGEVQQAVQKAPVFSLSDEYKGIVKIEVACLQPDFCTPWQTGRYVQGVGTGFLVEGGLFMTNAHVVSNAERIYISRFGDSRKSRARVKYVAHDADLALLEVENPEEFANIPHLEFDDSLPELEDEVRTIGYPIGGARLSVTRGIVSRIENTEYAHDRRSSHLTVQVDAAINPGNSGGPVLKGDRVIGVAFQGLLGANSTGYVIPAPVIQRFLKDVSDGSYDRYVSLGAAIRPIENPAMRRYLGLQDDERGALVSEVIPGCSADGVLLPGDVLMKIQGCEVDSSGMVQIDGQRVLFKELIERRFAGDTIELDIVRKGAPLHVQVTLRPYIGDEIMAKSFDTLPRYVMFGGLLFQPLRRDVVEAHQVAPSVYVPVLHDFINRGGWMQRDDVVMLTKVLPDAVNSQITGYGTRIIKKVNGQEVKGLSHLCELLYPSDGNRPEYVVLEFEEGGRPVVFSSASIDEANRRIAQQYAIPENARLSSERPVQH